MLKSNPNLSAILPMLFMDRSKAPQNQMTNPQEQYMMYTMKHHRVQFPENLGGCPRM
jgi:hypothetical protein